MTLLVDRSRTTDHVFTADARDASSPDREIALLTLRFWICALLAVLLVLLAFSEVVTSMWRLRRLADLPWLQLMLAGPVVLWGGSYFWRRLSKSVVRPNVWTFIGLAVGLSFGISVLVVVAPNVFPDALRDARGRLPLYFDASALLVTIALLGEMLEQRARRQSRNAAMGLVARAPAKACRLDAVATGACIDAQSARDSDLPASRSGRIVEDVEVRRTPIDWVSKLAVRQILFGVLGLALLTFVYHWLFGAEPRALRGFEHAISVWIVACPCAVAVAVPLAVLLGTSLASRHGLLVKNAAAFEALARADVLLLPKTGILTVGHPELVGVDVLDAGYDDQRLLALAAGLEAGTSHPSGLAIRAAIEGFDIVALEVKTLEPVIGRGVRGQYAGRTVGLGNLALLAEHGIRTDGLRERSRRYEDEGQSVVWVFDDDCVVGAIVLADKLATGAKSALEALREHRIEVAILTGDSKVTARAIAAELEIEDVAAEFLPEAKAEFVAQWQGEGWVVAVVGDGANDAPALARADVGIAMSTGSDVAIEAAGITLVGGGLDALVRARAIAVRTRRNARQNLFVAIGVSLVALPVAVGFVKIPVGLHLTSTLAACVAGLGTLLVVANANRLRTATGALLGQPSSAHE